MSQRARVHVSRRVPLVVRSELESIFDLSLHDSMTPAPRVELLAHVTGCDGLVTMLTDQVDRTFLDAAGSQLRVIANYAVGYDNVDLEECSRRSVIVTNTPGVLTDTTAELTFALLLSLVRRVAEGDRMLRSRDPWIWAPTHLLGVGLNGLTLGIVGLGRIGSEVGRLAAAFGMHVLYTDAGSARGERGELGPPWERVSFGQLIERANVVTLHCPLTKKTRHLINAEVLEAMRPDAYLLNTSRGPVVDEKALADALVEGKIAGAALDVYEREPSVEARLVACENVVLTPHLGSATIATRTAMGMICVSALRTVLIDGRVPANAVNSSPVP